MSEAEDREARLSAAVAGFPGRRFVVVDGGHFEDFPLSLKRNRLFARSLFLDQADVEVQKAGPWLVGLDQDPQAMQKVLALIAAKPAAVFWCCDSGEAVLHRHLRTIAMARIPVWAADGKAAPEPSDDRDAYRTVFFRHFDPRVLGALLPCLEAAQFSRFLGPAEEVAFLSGEHGGLKRAVRDESWSPAPPGLLTVRSEQCRALIDRRVSASHKGLATYLRQYAPDHVADLDDASLQARVRLYETQAHALGVRDEDAVARWSFIQATSQTDLSRDVGVIRFMADNRAGHTPSERMNALMRLRTSILKERFG